MPKRIPRRPAAPEVCPVCGADVHRNALACRECGADHNSGWKDDAYAQDGLDLPGEEFDYEEFTRREFGGPPPVGMKSIWWLTAVVLLVIFAILYAVGRG